MLNLYVAFYAGLFSHHAVDLHSPCEYYDLYGYITALFHPDPSLRRRHGSSHRKRLIQQQQDFLAVPLQRDQGQHQRLPDVQPHLLSRPQQPRSGRASCRNGFLRRQAVRLLDAFLPATHPAHGVLRGPVRNALLHEPRDAQGQC